MAKGSRDKARGSAASRDGRTVYSTGVGRICPRCGRPAERCSCHVKTPRAPAEGRIRVRCEHKGRRGKIVTTVTGLGGTEETLRELSGELKRRCGSGGAVKDRVIEIQGDHRATVIEELRSRGHEVDS